MSSETRSLEADEFRLDPDAPVSGTGALTILTCPPVCLVELFGKPAEADGHKVSGEYRFTNDSGDVFTVHDWKATTLFWGTGPGVPTPEEFWEGEEPVDLWIGGRAGSNPSAFTEWLIQAHERYEDGLTKLIARLDRCRKQVRA